MEIKTHEYEVGLLGLMLVDENAFHTIKGQIKTSDFQDRRHQIIFNTISKVYDKGFEEIEITPITDQLKKDKNFEKVGGLDYLALLMERPTLKTNVNKYIKIISERNNLKLFLERLKKLTTEIENAKLEKTDEILSKIEGDLLELIRGTKIKEFMDSKTAIDKAIKKIEDRASGKIVSGIAVGLPSLDRITGGMQNGDLIIIAARPSMGKTAFALNIASYASQKKNVALFSLEMPFEQIYNRIISFTAFVDQSKLRESQYLTKDEWNKIHASKSQIEKMNLFIDDTAGIKLSELVWKAKNLHKNGKLDMIVIDYLQLIIVSQSLRDNRQNEVSLIARTLKKLARDLNVPVIALSQLSRRVEQRENKMPIMSDLRESGAIEQDADIVTFLYRDAYYNREKLEGDNNDREITDVIISKHRNGAIGNIKMFFKPSHGLFIEKDN